MRQYRKVCLETEGVVLTMWSSRVHKLDEVEGGWCVNITFAY
jgi:hypothetical protein